MRFARLFSIALVAGAPLAALAQDSTGGPSAKPAGKPGKVLLTPAEMATYAKTQVQLNKIQDSMDKQLAQPMNKKDQNQRDLRASMQAQTQATLQKNGLNQAAYDKVTYTIAVDS